MPIHPVLSTVGQASAPPLDILRRPVESYMVSTHVAAGAGAKAKERSSRWWICLIELKVAFYQCYGDSKQRFVANIRDSTVAVSKESSTTVIINFGDRKKWQFNFNSTAEAKKFSFVVNESKRVLDGNSMYFKKRDVSFVYNTDV
jgi:hypothetical protein